jgi:hypothetical protein
MQNSLRPPAAISKNLAALGQEDWEAIGRSFDSFLVSNSDAKSAVAEFIARYPALTEFDAQHVWFRPMLEVVALNALKEAPWGGKVRLYGGAGLGMFDMATDINVIVELLGGAATIGYGQNLLWLLILCLVFQLIFVFLQNRRAPGWVMARDMLYVLCCVKGGVDAHRVATGKEQEIYNVVDRKMELGKSILLLPRHGNPILSNSSRFLTHHYFSQSAGKL